MQLTIPEATGDLLAHLLKHDLVSLNEVLAHTVVTDGTLVHVSPTCYRLPTSGGRHQARGHHVAATTSQLLGAQPVYRGELKHDVPRRCLACWETPFDTTFRPGYLGYLKPVLPHLTWSAAVEAFCGGMPQGGKTGPRGLAQRRTYPLADIGIHRYLTLVGEHLPDDAQAIDTLSGRELPNLEAHLAVQHTRLAQWRPRWSTRLELRRQRRSSRTDLEPLWWTRFSHVPIHRHEEDDEAALAAFAAAEDVQFVSGGEHEGQLLARVPRRDVLEYESWHRRGAYLYVTALTDSADYTAEHVQAALVLDPDLRRDSLYSMKLLSSVRTALSQP